MNAIDVSQMVASINFNAQKVWQNFLLWLDYPIQVVNQWVSNNPQVKSNLQDMSSICLLVSFASLVVVPFLRKKRFPMIEYETGTIFINKTTGEEVKEKLTYRAHYCASHTVEQRIFQIGILLLIISAFSFLLKLLLKNLQ